jgi:hypothetical protein
MKSEPGRDDEGELVGLCGTCRFARRIKSARGATFYLCERSYDDSTYQRYPHLPVLACRGFVARFNNDAGND